MDMLKKCFPLSFKYTDSVANLIIGILIYLVAGAVAARMALPHDHHEPEEKGKKNPFKKDGFE